ncbi:hypothetical protein P0936_07595, partial [Acinetobacter nosocomialis]|nr:hypothetical protein [Acinetobacter nosocomialis]
MAFFYTYIKPKLPIYLKPYFATLAVAQVAFFIPVKIQYKLTITSFILRFAKALIALSCSGGVF